MFDKVQLNEFYRYSLSLTGDEQEAFDLLQECLVKWVRLDLKEVSDPKPYFLRILRNRFIDQARSKKRAIEYQEELESDIVSIQPIDPDQILIEREELNQILEKLSPLERELLYLWAVEEHTIDEISRIVDQPKGTILSRLHRMRKRIQSLEDSA